MFPSNRGPVRAVDGVSLEVESGGILGLVGESGCGKSMTLLSILRLVPYPGRTVAGRMWFDGADLLREAPAAMRRRRGRDISMVFQDPMTTLNPVFRVGEQIGESLRVHGALEPSGLGLLSGARRRRRAERERVLELMAEVGIPSPEARCLEYPHRFSGGLQQRALIAIALACRPRLLLADEPTTALDVTIQAQIVDLLARINRDHGTAVILVTHDLGLAAEFCREIAVMYAGRIVERGPAAAITSDPLHPYTRGLLRSLPRITLGRRRNLEPIPGSVPDLAQVSGPCAFADRCEEAVPDCCRTALRLAEADAGHWVRCGLYPACLEVTADARAG